MRTWSAKELTLVLGHPVSGDGRDSKGVSTDTRTISQDNIFVCLTGDTFDGHAYAALACQKGAASIVAERGKALSIQQSIPPDVNLWLVEDSLEALSKLGSQARSTLSCAVLGVAGSNGKTSTKDMLAGLAKQLFKNSFATAGNLNNHIGLPLTLANIPTDADFVILEMGMNHSGELAALSKIARPHHAIVTSVALEHAEFFSSIEDIARAELEIGVGMPAGGMLLYHAGSPCIGVAKEVADQSSVTLELYQTEGNVQVSAGGIAFDFQGQLVNNPYYFSRVMAENLYGSLRLMSAAGVSVQELVRVAPNIRPQAPRRFQVFRKNRAAGQSSSHSQILLIDDSYNANEASFVAAIKSMREILPNGKLALFAGEMAELGAIGPSAHASVGKSAGEMGFASVFASGTSEAQILLDGYRAHFKEGKTVLATEPATLLEQFDPEEFDGILVKGSRRARMDLVSDAIKKRGFVGQADNV